MVNIGVYGIDYYGTGRFGRDPQLVRPDFSVDPFEAMALDYSTLHLTWQKPQSSNCTFLRLVRNPRNLPQDEDDGLYLWGDATTNPPYAEPVQRTASLTDMGLSNGFFYYTMWGWDSVNLIWIRCTDLIALVPINWGYGYRLYNLIPMAYRDLDAVLVDPYNPWPVDSPRPPLRRYLSLLGFQVDFIRTELESLMSVNDAQNCSGALLPLLAQQLGLQNEPEIGMQQERQLISNAVHLYKLKGSPRGISEFSSVLTSYPMTTLAHHGYNVLLCRDDSIAETSIGTWQAWPPPISKFPGVVGNNGLTLTQNPNMLGDASAVPPIPPVSGMTNPLEVYPGFNPGPPTYNYSGTQAKVTGGGDIYITTARIPVTDFMSSSYGPGVVTWRVQLWSSVSRQVELSLWGDNGNGIPTQILAPQNFTETAGRWTLMTISGAINPYPNGLSKPAAYYWVFPRIRIIATAANEPHYYTLMGLWPCTPSDLGVNTSIYDYPRDVKVTLSPQASNLLSNPLTAFTNGFDGLTTAADPLQASLNLTCSMQIHYVSSEDPASLFGVNGSASLQVITVGPNGTVWFGSVGSFSIPQPTYPQGWFSDTAHDWFGGSSPGQAATRPWFDPVNSWFFENNQYFSIGDPVIGGNWFPTPAQPPLNGNLVPFNVPAYQPFNFSVYGRNLQVLDPSNAAMQMGFRWYYPDGSWTETFTQYSLSSSFERYAIAPSDPNLAWMANPPTQPQTNAQPTTMFPFVRFPYAQQATFLLNSAMLSPGTQIPPYFDASLYPGNPDYMPDSHGASYYFRHFKPRTFRLKAELYRWIPMGASHTEIFAAESIQPPLDPTLWTHPALVLRGTTTMTVTPS